MKGMQKGRIFLMGRLTILANDGILPLLAYKTSLRLAFDAQKNGVSLFSNYTGWPESNPCSLAQASNTSLSLLRMEYHHYLHISLGVDANFHTHQIGVNLYGRIKGKIIYD